MSLGGMVSQIATMLRDDLGGYQRRYGSRSNGWHCGGKIQIEHIGFDILTSPLAPNYLTHHR